MKAEQKRKLEMTNNPDINQKVNNLIAGRVNQEIDEQIIEARQILSEMETIDSSAAYTLVKRRIRTHNKTYIINIIIKVAAFLFIPLLITSILLFNRQINPTDFQQYSMQEITSPPGIRSKVILPDGSMVWLNAESTIKFPIPFHKDDRSIELLGEAFFEVTKNPHLPFIVESGKIKVKVLGTKFNYKAFANDPDIEVTLEEGKIALDILGKVGAEETLLIPGDRFVYEKKSNKASIKHEDIKKYIAWHTGKLIFDNSPMAEVAQMLSRWYGIEVIVKDAEVMNYRFTTTFENESLLQVIELFGLSSPVDIKYIPATLGRDNQMQTKSKISISKKINKNK